LEWSRSAVRMYDPTTRKLTSADSIAGLGALPREVILALSRRTAFLRIVSMPAAKKEDLRAIAAIQLGNHFPIPVQELAYDLLPTDEATPDGKKVLVAGVRQADLRTALALLKDAGTSVVKTLPTAMGSMYLTSGVGVVLESTPEGVGIDVVSGGVPHLSRLASPAGPGGIPAEVERTCQVAGVSGAAIHTAPGLDVGTGVALASHPLEALSQHGLECPLDLELPELVAARESRKSGNRVRIAVLTALSAILFGALVWDDRERASQVVKRGEAKWNAELRKLRSIRESLSAESQKEKKYEAMTALALEPAQRAGDVLTVIANSVPKGVWLTGYSFDRGKPVQVRGSARNSADVKQFLNNLEQQSRLRDVKLVFANTGKIEDTPVVQFSITAFPVGNLPLAQPERKRAATRSAN
jgi:Tfp pilus assembly protein PilN